MIREYITPDFDVTVYEVEDVITASLGGEELDGGALEGDGWFN